MNPNPRPLQRVLQQLFQAQARDVARRVRLDSDDVPDLTHWVQAMADAARPHVLSSFQAGMAERARRLAAQTGGRLSLRRGRHQLASTASAGGGNGPGTVANRTGTRLAVLPSGEVFAPRVRKEWRGWWPELTGVRTKAPTASPSWGGGRSPAGSIQLDFDLFHPQVVDAVDDATMIFCRETNATATGELKAVLAKLRQALKEGLARGDAVAFLAQQIRRLFAEPYRAWRIASTEISRAMHGGALLAAKESGIVKKKRWLTSADACDRCILMNGKEVPLDQPFWVDPKGGPYAVIMFPPLHPQCMCDFTDVL